ncbi:MAG: hypothetical protein K2Z76_15370 [Mycobacterium gordonae]|nr:hypothetical protein [Mycobacterium gordonae]
MRNGVRVEQSCTLPVVAEQAFTGIIEMAAVTMFRRRYGRSPDPGSERAPADNWSGTVGQTRVLELGPRRQHWGGRRQRR